MSQVIQATCPKCKKMLTIPREWLSSTIRCQGCGQVLKAGARPAAPAKPASRNGTTARSQPAPQPKTSDTPEEEGGSLLIKLKERRRRRFYIKLLIAAFLLINAGLAALIWRDDLQALVERALAAIRKEEQPVVASAPKPETKPATKPDDRPPRNLAKVDTKPEANGKPKTEVKPPKSDGENKPVVKPEEEPAKPVESPPLTTTLAKAYPGRALLVGIRNYLYVNPLNPGYRPNSFSTDPLGLHSLKKVLIEGLKFDKNQVIELSDVAADQPHSPLKATMQATIQQFLESSRPQDRVVLLFAGHAVEIEEKGYLVPLEGEFTKKDELVPVAWLYEQLDKCKAHRKLLILDVAHLDPEQGLARSGGEKMGEKLEAQLKKAPEGVQVWLSCSGKENSYEFASSGFIGSVFLHYLQDFAKELADPAKRKELEKEPGYAQESLPLVFLAPKVNKEVTDYVKNRWNSVQSPQLFGVAAKAPEVAANAAPPPAIAIVQPNGDQKLADTRLIDDLVQEISLPDLGAQSLPPFFAKNLEAYQTPADMDADPEKHPLRQATLNTIKKLKDQNFDAEKQIRAEPNDAAFKKKIEQQQKKPAVLDQELGDVMNEMEKAGQMRAKETKRWQAHYDYIFTQLLARRIAVMEYNFVLGNKLRKDSPVVKNPKNNGWLIVPSEKLQQKDTRDWEKKRQEILDRLSKEHPGTPWDIIARRDKGTYLGLTIQEAKVD